MIFVKYPEPGSVKARLAKTIGTGEAARLYRLIAEDIIPLRGNKSMKEGRSI